MAACAQGRHPLLVEVTGHTLLRDGHPARLVLVQDITDRRQAEERSRLISHVFESTEEGIFITDARNRFISVNRAFSRITGYSPQELLGKTPALLKSGRQNRAFYAELWKQLHTEGRWEGEIWNRNKAGEVYPEWLAINAIKDAQGRSSSTWASSPRPPAASRPRNASCGWPRTTASPTCPTGRCWRTAPRWC
jgi:PAS domain S-box-containing protein